MIWPLLRFLSSHDCRKLKRESRGEKARKTKRKKKEKEETKQLLLSVLPLTIFTSCPFPASESASMEGQCKRRSSLSALAEPFKMSNPFQRQFRAYSLNPSTDTGHQTLGRSVSSVDSFSSLELDDESLGDYRYSDYDFGASVPGFLLPHGYLEKPSVPSRILSSWASTSMCESSGINPATKISGFACEVATSGIEDHGSQGEGKTGGGFQGDIILKEKNADDSLGYPVFIKQGPNYQETCDSLCLNYLETFAREDQIQSVDGLPSVKCEQNTKDPETGPKVAEGGSSGEDLVLVLDKNELEECDSDIDSPCWKGLKYHDSPFRESKAPDWQLHKNRSEARRSLNPDAPLFFPRISKYLSPKERECTVDDMLPSHNSALSASGCCSSSEVSSLIDGQHLDETRGLSKDHAMNGNTSIFGVVDLGITLPLKEDYLTCNGSGTYVGDPGIIARDVTVDDAAAVSLSEAMHVPELNAQEHSMSSGTDVGVLVAAMYNISEMLVEKCLSGYKLNGLLHNKVQAVISNLSTCKTASKGRLRSSFNIPSSPKISSGQNKSADAFMVTDSTLSDKGLQDLCPSLSNTGNGMPQTIKKSLNAGCGEDILNPQTLLYKNLWLEAQEALHSLKLKASTRHGQK